MSRVVAVDATVEAPWMVGFPLTVNSPTGLRSTRSRFPLSGGVCIYAANGAAVSISKAPLTFRAARPVVSGAARPATLGATA
jgi:hypothetical protein